VCPILLLFPLGDGGGRPPEGPVKFLAAKRFGETPVQPCVKPFA